MWARTAWQHISPQVIVKGVPKCYTYNAVGGANDDSCGMAITGKGMLRVSVRKD